MCKILIFGGTSEGRILSEFCAENHIRSVISVTTDYGAKLISESSYVKVKTGRMNFDEIRDFINKNKITSVFDATHPYAENATENIKNACFFANVSYVRVCREKSKTISQGIYFNNIDKVISYLNNHDGNIFITTGSKELPRFCGVDNFSERCTVRILDNRKIYEECVFSGFDKNKIIVGKGPFSEEKNIIHMRKNHADFVVTKDSGDVGGFYEKVSAAEKVGARLLIIKRPDDSGISLEEAKKIIMRCKK